MADSSSGAGPWCLASRARAGLAILAALAGVAVLAGCGGNGEIKREAADLIVFEDTTGDGAEARLSADPAVEWLALGANPVRYRAPVIEARELERVRHILPPLAPATPTGDNPVAIAHVFIAALLEGNRTMLVSVLAPRSPLPLPPVDAPDARWQETLAVARRRLPRTIGVLGWGAADGPDAPANGTNGAGLAGADAAPLTIQVALAPEAGGRLTLLLLMQWQPDDPAMQAGPGRWRILDARRALRDDAGFATRPLIARYADPAQPAWPEHPPAGDAGDTADVRRVVRRLLTARNPDVRQRLIATEPVATDRLADLFPAWVVYAPAPQELADRVRLASADAPDIVDLAELHRYRTADGHVVAEYLLTLGSDLGPPRTFALTLQRTAGPDRGTWQLADFRVLLTRAPQPGDTR